MQCRWLLLITGRAFSLGCLISADRQRCAIRAKAVSVGQHGLDDSQAALGTRQQWRQEEWGAGCIGCTQQAHAGPGARGASGPQRHQCQAGKAICASCAREGEKGLHDAPCHRSPTLMQCVCRWERENSDPLPSQRHLLCPGWSRETWGKRR